LVIDLDYPILKNIFSPFKRLSIQQKLPLLICILLLSAILIFSLATYYGLKKATIAIGKDRLQTLTNQLSSMLAQSAQSVIVIIHAIAEQNTVKECLRSGGKEFHKEVVESLDKLHRDSTWVLTELLDTNGVPMLRSDKSTVDVKVGIKDVLASTNVGPGISKVGKIYNVKGIMYCPAITAVADKGHTIGYIVSWQWIRSDPQTVTQLTQLMGTGATLYIGNTDGSLWTDMISPVQGPPVKMKQIHGFIEYVTIDGRRVIATAQPVANTNWLVLVEFSEKNILKGVTSFVNSIAIIGLVLTAIGILGAWIISYNITQPLKQLTGAATAIAHGNYSKAVNVDRNDELGELAYAFNIMSEYVQQTQQELEEKVRESTAELREEIILRKQSEEDLRISSQRYHQLVEEVKDYSIIMLDVDGNVLVWNKGAEKIKGYKEEEILGKSFVCFYTEEDIKIDKPRKFLEKAALEGRSHDEGWRIRKGGEKFWADVVFTAIYEDDHKLLGFSKITRDVTERKKLEEERRIISIKLEERIKEVAIRTSQLEMANKELEAFSYSVSHDLRTPLRAISGYSIMLKEDYESKLDEEGNRVIRNIMTNAKMMGQLIDDLLAFSRLGRKELIRTEVNMQLLATNVVNELLQNELEKDYRININSLHTAEADQGMIKQVLINLVSNAIKYSSKKAGPEIEIGSRDEETKTIYYIKDNGVGFDMAYSGKLFGVFQRLHSQEEFEGTGVGLALTKRIIDKHNGEIWAEGLENIGATFYFSLPKTSKYE
jgi:PAS domain S-box-containing protein